MGVVLLKKILCLTAVVRIQILLCTNLNIVKYSNTAHSCLSHSCLKLHNNWKELSDINLVDCFHFIKIYVWPKLTGNYVLAKVCQRPPLPPLGFFSCSLSWHGSHLEGRSWFGFNPLVIFLSSGTENYPTPPSIPASSLSLPTPVSSWVPLRHGALIWPVFAFPT